MTGGWHPKVRAAKDNWLQLRSDGLLPGRSDFDPIAVSALLPNIFLIDVQVEPLRFRFRLVGTAIVFVLGNERTGQWLDDCIEGFENSAFANDLKVVVGERQPHYFRGLPSIPFSRDVAEVERLILPLARDGRNVDMLLGVSVFFDRKGHEVGLPKR